MGWPREYDVVIEVGVLLEHPGIIHCWNLENISVYRLYLTFCFQMINMMKFKFGRSNKEMSITNQTKCFLKPLFLY